MKQTVRVLIALMVVFGIIMASAPHQTQAVYISESVIAGGSWSEGSETDISTMVASVPNWIQVLTNGVKVTEPGEICHPFRGGQFGWVGQIRQYKDGQWVKIPTVNGWVPSTEGEYMACAKAPTAGTYALFGYYIAPELVAQPSVDCSPYQWSDLYVGYEGNYYFEGYVTGVEAGTVVNYTIVSSIPLGATASGAGTTDGAGYFSFDSGIDTDDYSSITVTFYVVSSSCSSPEVTGTFEPLG